MDDKWCCDGLKHAFAQRRERGIFVIAEPPGESRDSAAFFVAMRSVDTHRLDELRALPLPEDMPITIATRLAIKHCPWCGRSLARFYRRRYRQLVDAALSQEYGG